MWSRKQAGNWCGNSHTCTLDPFADIKEIVVPYISKMKGYLYFWIIFINVTCIFWSSLQFALLSLDPSCCTAHWWLHLRLLTHLSTSVWFERFILLIDIDPNSSGAAECACAHHSLQKNNPHCCVLRLTRWWWWWRACSEHIKILHFLYFCSPHVCIVHRLQPQFPLCAASRLEARSRFGAFLNLIKQNVQVTPQQQ